MNAREQGAENREVLYFRDAKGFFASPPGSPPGIILVHEWWGLNHGVKDAAERLSREGYAVLAVDLFHGTVAGSPEEAMALVKSLDQAEALENIHAAKEFLRKKDIRLIAVMGWCFGGGQSMLFSLDTSGLRASVIYYGSLVTDIEKLSSIKWPVLGIFGGDDKVVPVSDVEAFRRSLSALGIRNEIYIYPGMGHAFASPSDSRKDTPEARDAWEKTLKFLDRNLRH